MKVVFGSFALILLMLLGCYRPSLREVRLYIPETEGNEAELTLLKNYLLSEESNLRDGLRFYESITVHAEESSLDILYSRRHLADQNIISKIHRIGYTVNDFPGNPEVLKQNRETLNLR